MYMAEIYFTNLTNLIIAVLIQPFGDDSLHTNHHSSDVTTPSHSNSSRYAYAYMTYFRTHYVY